MKEKFDDTFCFTKWTTEDFIKAQEDMKKLIEMYNNNEKIIDMDFFETIEDHKNSFENIFQDFDLLLDGVYPDENTY